jgi:hypothetical protein
VDMAIEGRASKKQIDASVGHFIENTPDALMWFAFIVCVTASNSTSKIIRAR